MMSSTVMLPPMADWRTGKQRPADRSRLVTLSADSAVTNRGTLSAQDGNLSLKTATLANSGSLAALSGLAVTAGSGVTNDQNGQIAVESGSLSLRAGGSPQ